MVGDHMGILGAVVFEPHPPPLLFFFFAARRDGGPAPAGAGGWGGVRARARRFFDSPTGRGPPLGFSLCPTRSGRSVGRGDPEGGTPC